MDFEKLEAFLQNNTRAVVQSIYPLDILMVTNMNSVISTALGVNHSKLILIQLNGQSLTVVASLVAG